MIKNVKDIVTATPEEVLEFLTENVYCYQTIGRIETADDLETVQKNLADTTNVYSFLVCAQAYIRLQLDKTSRQEQKEEYKRLDSIRFLINGAVDVTKAQNFATSRIGTLHKQQLDELHMSESYK